MCEHNMDNNESVPSGECIIIYVVVVLRHITATMHVKYTSL